MSKVFFELVIDTKPDKYPAINSLLGVTDAGKKGYWGYEIIVDEGPLEISQPTVLLHFMSILDGKFQALHEVGIQRSNIVIYMTYEYDVQCNMEFLPEELLLLGQNGIVLAVSCYQS